MNYTKIKKIIVGTAAVSSFVLPIMPAEAETVLYSDNGIAIDQNSITVDYNGQDVTNWYHSTFFNNAEYQPTVASVATTADSYQIAHAALVPGQANSQNTTYADSEADTNADFSEIGLGKNNLFAGVFTYSAPNENPSSAYASAAIKQPIYLYTGTTTFTFNYYYGLGIDGVPFNGDVSTNDTINP